MTPEAPESFIESQEGELGEVRIANDVVSTIAGLAAVEVEGVAGMSGGGLTEILGRRSVSRGVRVEVGQHQAAIDLFVVVQYGVRIPDVAWKVQENVKRQIETMTGLEVTEVNVHVQAVQLPQSERSEEARVR